MQLPVKVQNALNLVNKVTPFQVQQNRQLVSVPAHRETGMNIERVFRAIITIPAGGDFQAVLFTALQTAIVAELGIPAPAGAYQYGFTVKKLTAYSTANMVVRIFYQSDRINNTVGQEAVQFTDMTSDGGIATVSVVYPTAARPNWVSSSIPSTSICLLANTGGASAFAQEVFIDVVVNIRTLASSNTPGLYSAAAFKEPVTSLFTPPRLVALDCAAFEDEGPSD